MFYAPTIVNIAAAVIIITASTALDIITQHTTFIVIAVVIAILTFMNSLAESFIRLVFYKYRILSKLDQTFTLVRYNTHHFAFYRYTN
jgi:Na+-transporting NADH:ubiquinone oxidoreductase subunit NqrD